jgi:molecular chaperone DnaK (HSP70)
MSDTFAGFDYGTSHCAIALITEVRVQSGDVPEAIYLTGGMARSQVVRDHLARICGDVPPIDSDHFTSVRALGGPRLRVR